MNNDPLKSLRAYFFAAGFLLLCLSPALDLTVVNWVRQYWHVTGVGVWSRAAHAVGLGYVLFGICAILWFWAKNKGDDYLKTTALAGAVSVLASGLSAQILKHLIGRPRPRLNLSPFDLTGFNLDSDFSSMPSGHTTTSFALAVVFASRFPRQAWIFYSIAAWVGVGRVLSGSHYLSDVMAATILGIMVGLVLKTVFFKTRVGNAA